MLRSLATSSAARSSGDPSWRTVPSLILPRSDAQALANSSDVEASTGTLRSSSVAVTVGVFPARSAATFRAPLSRSSATTGATHALPAFVATRCRHGPPSCMCAAQTLEPERSSATA